MKIWTVEGQCLFSSEKHRGPVFSLKFNPSGSYLLSCGLDQTILLWKTDFQNSTFEFIKSFSFHNGFNSYCVYLLLGTVLDLSWKNDSTFASCGVDKKVCIGDVSKDEPISTYEEHSLDINSVEWSPSRILLASCSDDKTCKIYSTDKQQSLFTLKGHFYHLILGHTKEIYTLSWSPSTSFDADRLLAT
jgi:transducin (beta)-like 1